MIHRRDFGYNLIRDYLGMDDLITENMLTILERQLNPNNENFLSYRQFI